MKKRAVGRSERTDTTSFCCSGAQMLLDAQSVCIEEVKVEG